MSDERPSSVAIGVDVGGTKVAAGLVDSRGAVIGLRNRPTGGPGMTSLHEVARLVGQLSIEAADSGFAVGAIGLALPEVIDPNGRVGSDAVVGWDEASISGVLSPIAPFVIEADVRAAAIAEARLGERPTDLPWVYVNFGTGISHCLVLAGRPYSGAHGAAILSGSTEFHVHDVETGRLIRARAEDVASGRAISDRYRDITGDAIEAAEVARLAQNGDRHAKAIVDRATEVQGALVGTLIDLLDPGLVVVGGGLMRAPGAVEAVASFAGQTSWLRRDPPIPVVGSRAGDAAGVIGAGMVALERSSGAERSVATSPVAGS